MSSNHPEEILLTYQERLLIRKAILRMAYQASVSKDDAELLQRLEHQLADANEIVLKGGRL